VRRVEELTGDNALAHVQDMGGALGGVAGTLPVVKPEVPARANALLDHMRLLEKALNALKRRLAWAQADEPVARAVQVAGIKMLAATLQGADAKALREETLGKLKDRLKSAAIVLATVDGGKVQCSWPPASLPTTWSTSRPASWSTSSASRSAASRTWRWTVAPIRRSCPRRWIRCATGWRSGSDPRE